MQAIQKFNNLNFMSFGGIQKFIDRNIDAAFKGNQLSIIKADILMQQGHVGEASESLEMIFNKETLLMRAQIELFSGNFRKSILFFDNARVVDEFGNKTSKTELGC